MKFCSKVLPFLLVLALSSVGCSKYIWTDVNRESPSMVVTDTNGDDHNIPASGKVTVLHFWTLTEGISRKSLEPIDKVARYLKKEEGEFLSINTGWGTTESEVLRLLRRLDISYEVVLDADQSIQRKFGVSSVPQTLLIDSDGNIDWIMHGYRDDINYAQTIIDKIKEME